MALVELSGIEPLTSTLPVLRSTFNLAIVPPSSLTTLTSDIAAAKALLPVTEGTVPGNHVVGSSATLTDAITAAGLITSAEDQSIVDAADATLNAAVATFNLAIVPPSSLSSVHTAAIRLCPFDCAQG